MGQQLLFDFDQDLDETLLEDEVHPNLSFQVTTQPQSSNIGGRGIAAPVRSAERIEDVGEVILGARKDMLRDVARMTENLTEQALIEKPLAKVFKKLDLKKAVEQGILREKDARFYEAVYHALLDTRKPKLKESDARFKKWNPDYKTPVERWARNFSEAAKILNSFVLSTEKDRDLTMDLMMSEHFTDKEGYARSCPNPVWVIYEALDKMRYHAGDSINMPYTLAVPRGESDYTLINNKGEYARLPYASSLDECIDNMIYLTRLKSGQADLEHPLGSFTISSTRAIYEETGNYKVIWGSMRNYHVEKFTSKEVADALAAQKNARGITSIVSPERNIIGHTDYMISFYHPLTGEKMKLGEELFETEQEASAYLRENYPDLNDIANQRIAAELEKKGERKPLRPENVVRISSVFKGYGKDWKYSVQIDEKYANNYGEPYSIKEFDTRKEALDFYEANKESIFKVVSDYMESHKKLVFYDTGEDSRFGEDYRHGGNVGAEDFMIEFGFRGVQFGNWTNQEDRQMAVNQAYDAFHDLARLLDVSPRAISLNGELGIAFGSRGTGIYSAHYEPYEVVINLTKTRGAGALAHEWWHAQDNYFARQAGVKHDFVTENRDIDMRQPLCQAFNDMLEKVRDTDYYKRSIGMRNSKYWGSPTEVTARLFEEWVAQELKSRGELNTFLSRGTNMEYTLEHNYIRYQALSKIAGIEPLDRESFRDRREALAGFPYPTPKEISEIGDSVRTIFDRVLEKEDVDTGRVALFHRVEEMLDDSVAPIVAALNEQERVLRDGLVARMREAGLDISTDWNEGQQVLEADLERQARLMGTTTINKMSNLRNEVSGLILDDNQLKIISVFVGDKDRQLICFNREEGSNIMIEFQQGKDELFGTKHSLYGHYRTTRGVITADDVLLIPDIIRFGARLQNGNRFEYQLNVNNKKLTVITERRGSKEIFGDLFSNWKIKKKNDPIVGRSSTEGDTSDGVQSRDIGTIPDARTLDTDYSSAAKLEQKNENTKEDEENISFHKVFHGSNADFDRFEHHFMGTCAGAPLVWGTSVTESESIGKLYAKLNTPRTFRGMDFQTISERQRLLPSSSESYWQLAAAANIILSLDSGASYSRAMKENSMSNSVRIQYYLEQIEKANAEGRKSKSFEYSYYLDNFKKLAHAYESMTPDDFPEVAHVLYTVDIPSDNGKNYLDHSKRLTEQEWKRCMDILKSALKSKGEDVKWMDGIEYGYHEAKETGADIYKRFDHYLGSSKEASAVLHEAGYAGIKYSSGRFGSFRGKNFDSYNDYVIFSEKDLDIKDKVRFFRTGNGEAYGFTLAGKVYIDSKIATSETPIHEYSHLWAAALRSGNPEEWKNVVSLMKECKSLWAKVKINYPELKTDDEIADEVLAHYSGSRGAERLREEQKLDMDAVTDEMQREGIASMFDKVREALGKFWNAVADMLHIHYKSADEVADRVLYDLLNRSILEERINPLDARQDVPDYRIHFSQTIKDSPIIDGISPETIQSVEQRLGDEKITSRNYSEKIAHINELFKFYQSGVQEYLPYREVFPTPTLDDYYIDTEVVFKSIGSKVSFESTADNKLALPPSVVKAGKDNLNQWRKMKESGQFEFHESPNYLSGSQYLIDRQSGDIYRYSGHWGKVASCNWDIDADEIQFLFLIGKANIKDFRSHASFKYQAENPDWKAGYAAALAKTVENYKALLNSRIQMTSVVRKQVSDKLQMYEGLINSLNDSGHIENRYNLRMSKVGMSLPVTDDKREMNKDNDKSPTTEKSDNPLNDTITMEQQEQKNEQQQVQKQSGVERHAEILIAGLERAMQKDGLFVNEQQKARPMIYGKDYRLGGVNSLVMALRSDEAGYKTNAYLLFNDVQKRGEAVRKGQTNTPIIWVNRNEYVSKENPEDRIDARQFKELGPAEQAKYRLNPREDAIAAFNIDQTTMRSAHKTEYENFVSAYAGFEKQDSYLSETDMALRKEVNDFLKQMKANLVPIHNDKQKTGVVSYDENRDVIVLPSQKNFESYNDYVQAAVGHVVMATSIPGRLNRDNRDEQRESLVQDLTTAVKMLDFGLPAKLRPETMESLPQLIGKMKDDPRFAEGIIRDVNRTYSMITKAELGSRIEVRPVPSVESSPEKYHAVTMVKDDENKWTLVMKPEEGPVLAVHPFGKDTARYFDEVKSGSKESVEEMRTELARKYYALATEKKIPTVNLFESKASQEELALISKVNMIKVQDGKMLLVAHVDGEKQKPAVITQEQWNRLWLAGDKQSYKTHLAATLYADVIAAKLAAGIQTAKVQAEDQAKRANENQTQQVEQAKKQEEEKRRNSPEQKEKERREEQAKKELTKAETKAVAAVALAPMFQQFLDIKGRNSDRILLMHVDDRYETYQDDARKVSKLAQLPLQKSASAKDAEGKPVVFVSFPEHKLDTYLPMLVRHNESVALADDLTRPKAEKEQPEVMRQNPVEKNVEQTLTEQRGGGMRR